MFKGEEEDVVVTFEKWVLGKTWEQFEIEGPIWPWGGKDTYFWVNKKRKKVALLMVPQAVPANPVAKKAL